MASGMAHYLHSCLTIICSFCEGLHTVTSERMDPIGVFDSGLGGLSVLHAIRDLLPHENVVYFADQGHVPYGSRPLEEVRTYSEAITRFLLSQRAKLIVVACNTASAAALHLLRHTFPDIPFVGMEPAVKPAAESTRTGKVGILATPATFQGALYESVVERFAANVNLFQDTCPGLVQQIEIGELDTPATRLILEKALRPMLAEGIDTVVLGCTHYPFVIPLIREITGSDVRVIDPAPAIARQTARLLDQHGISRMDSGSNLQRGRLHFYTSGDARRLERLLPGFLGESGKIRAVQWYGGTITGF